MVPPLTFLGSTVIRQHQSESCRHCLMTSSASWADEVPNKYWRYATFSGRNNRSRSRFSRSNVCSRVRILSATSGSRSLRCWLSYNSSSFRNKWRGVSSLAVSRTECCKSSVSLARWWTNSAVLPDPRDSTSGSPAAR